MVHTYKKKKKDLGILLFGKANPLPYSFLFICMVRVYFVVDLICAVYNNKIHHF